MPEPFEALHVTLQRDAYMDKYGQDGRACLIGDIHRETMGPCMFSTVYRPFEGKAPDLKITSLTPLVGPYRRDKYHAVKICDGRKTDYWLVQRDLRKPKTIEICRDKVTIRTDASAVLISTGPSAKPKGFRIGGTFVQLNGKRISLPNKKLERFATERA